MYKAGFFLSKSLSNAIKIIAAVLVMLSHYSQYICANDLSDSIIFSVISSLGGYLGVSLFFFLSGYGLMESEKNSHLNAIKFLKKRFLKVYLPVISVTLLWLAISSLIMTISPFSTLTIGGVRFWLSVLYCDFGDGVLWFIKVLIILYVLFYFFTTVYTYNKFLAINVLFGLTILLSLLIANISSEFQAISVPLFSLGVYMSLYKGIKKQLIYYISYVCIITVTWFILFDKNIAFHFVINALILTSIVIGLTIKQVDIKVPTILGVISFDIYLIHNKVILGLKDNLEFIPLWLFLTITAVATYLFYSFRTKILKI